jgi:acyl carrier protein
MTTYERVTRIISEVIGIPSDEITPSATIPELTAKAARTMVVTPESRLIDDLGADSLDMVEIVMALEEEFDIEDGEELANKSWQEVSIQEIVDFIDDHRR